MARDKTSSTPNCRGSCDEDPLQRPISGFPHAMRPSPRRHSVPAAAGGKLGDCGFKADIAVIWDVRGGGSGTICLGLGLVPDIGTSGHDFFKFSLHVIASNHVDG